MTAPLLLLALACLTGLTGSRLSRLSWPRRAPRLGVLLWQSLSWCFVVSLLLAGLALAFPAMPWAVNTGVAEFLGACAVAIRDHYATPGGAVLGAVGALAAAVVILRIGVWLAWDGWKLRRTRRRQRTAVMLVARHHPNLQAWVIEDARFAAYCLPGRSPMVVLTSGAVRVLHVSELRSVLAHERAHARGRHEVAIQVAGALQRAFPRVPLLQAAAQQIPELLEMHADDRAARAHGRQPLATALVRLAGAAPRGPAQFRAPLTVLFATGGGTLARVQRLVAQDHQLPRSRCWMAAVVVALALLAPAVVAVAPAVEAAILDYCPVLLN